MTNTKFDIKVINDPNKLIPNETRRVIKYLKIYKNLTKTGYAKSIRFPKVIDPNNPPSLEYELIKEIVKNEFIEIESLYMDYANKLNEIASKIENISPFVEKLYGYKIYGKHLVQPSAFGTVGSPGDIITFRIPKLRPNFMRKNSRTELEILTHEILAHKLTQHLREGTGISDHIKSTYHDHAEYLMDILGRTILTKTKLMNKKDVKIQRIYKELAQDDIDPIYYDENGEITWEGDLPNLIEKIINHLKSKNYS